MQHENTHFIQFESHSLLFRHYAFVDTKGHLADQLFIQEKVRVYFGKEAHHIDSDYCVIFCKVRKHDEANFLTALQKLPSKMLLLGHIDYHDFCRGFQELLDTPQEELHEQIHPIKKADKTGTASLLRKAARFMERPLPCHQADREWEELLPSEEQTETSP